VRTIRTRATISHLSKRATSKFFAFFFAHFYPRLEPGAVRDWRRGLVARASGRVLEIGVGPGLNLPLYPSGVELFGLDPDPAMLRHARRRARGLGRQVTLVRAEAEAISLPADFFDTVVSIFTFCSVRRPDAAAREIYRVLRPGGRLLFMEHVRSAHPAWARLQRAVAPAWSLCAGGCRLDRDTLGCFLDAGFVLEPVARAGGGILPVVRGVALKRD